MTDFLQLCKDTARKCRVSGTGPTTTVSQTGELGRIVDSVDRQYAALQRRHEEWRWLRHTFTLNTVASTDEYASGDCVDSTTGNAIDRFGDWRLNDWEDPPKIYLNSTGISGQRWLIYVPWSWFKMVYKIGSNTTNEGPPAHITVDPQNNIVLGPIPDAVYVVTGDYKRRPQILSDDSDPDNAVPEMPEQFHDLIMWMAVKEYAMQESDQGLLALAQGEMNPLYNQLEKNQLPRIRKGRALA